MSLRINLHHLENHPLVLKEDLGVEEMKWEVEDELVHLQSPLRCELLVQAEPGGILVQGRLEIVLDCECARCLKSFQQTLTVPDLAILIPLEGEEKATVVNDCVDLTPYLREDILLALPQHPLCDAQCGGLSDTLSAHLKGPQEPQSDGIVSSAWAELNKLKF